MDPGVTILQLELVEPTTCFVLWNTQCMVKHSSGVFGRRLKVLDFIHDKVQTMA